VTKHIPINVARAVIVGDTESLRFEAFANDIVSEIEGGRVVLSTSLTYDRGRDGKTVGPGARVYVCSSLNDSPDEKAISDVEKIANSKIQVDRLYFCSSQKLTEYAADVITAAIREKLGQGVSIDVLGAAALADFAVRVPEVTTKHYSAEIQDIVRAFEDVDNGDIVARRALELALCTIGHTDSGAIRKSAYFSALRIVLRDGVARTLAECARDVSVRLKLGRSLPPLAVRPYIDDWWNIRSLICLLADTLRRLRGKGRRRMILKWQPKR
jgi:hypothetical protein